MMTATNRLQFYTTMSDSFSAMQDIEGHIAASPVSDSLRHLVKLRVSQINGCAYCVNMHIGEALKDGEKQQRLDQLVVWQHVDLFSDDERAALAWAEALTIPGTVPALDPIYEELQDHFDQKTIDALTLVIVMINNWNRLQIANHNQHF